MDGVSLTRMDGKAWQHRRKEQQRQEPGGGKPPGRLARALMWGVDVKEDERLYHRQGRQGPGGRLGEARAAWGHCCPPPAGEQGLSGWVRPGKHVQRLWQEGVYGTYPHGCWTVVPSQAFRTCHLVNEPMTASASGAPSALLFPAVRHMTKIQSHMVCKCWPSHPGLSPECWPKALAGPADA